MGISTNLSAKIILFESHISDLNYNVINSYLGFRFALKFTDNENESVGIRIGYESIGLGNGNFRIIFAKRLVKGGIYVEVYQGDKGVSVL